MSRAVFLFFSLLAAAWPAAADTLVATHTVRSRAVLSAEDLSVVPGTVAGALQDLGEAVGMEARVVLYAGRPIHPEHIGQPAAIERNEPVTLLYRQSGLSISVEGRALDRAAVGERVRAMNHESRVTVTGRVDAAGRILVEAPMPGR